MFKKKNRISDKEFLLLLAAPFYSKGFTYNYASDLIQPVFGIESGYICSAIPVLYLGDIQIKVK